MGTKKKLIAKLSSKYPIKALCKAIGVSRSSFYYKPKPKHSSKDLEEKVKSSFESSRKTYGTRRIKSDLEDQGITVYRRKIGQIMQKYKLISKYTLTAFKPGKSASNKDGLLNIVNQEFSADRPMQKLTTDLTYIRASGK
ncbi:IS3 family transposase [Streptococcus danieliae]|nr:IS3 family transposase [Streptococcus danieliae]